MEGRVAVFSYSYSGAKSGRVIEVLIDKPAPELFFGGGRLRFNFLNSAILL